MKNKTEIFDSDFLGNKIDIGDEVIFTAPCYRSLVIGKVITKATKSCQIEYINDWNYPQDGGVKEVVRQGYDQIIKRSAASVQVEQVMAILSEIQEFARQAPDANCVCKKIGAIRINILDMLNRR